MDKNGSMTVAQACEKLGVSTSGYYSQASKARHAGKAKRLKAGKAKRASKGKVESVSYASSESAKARDFSAPSQVVALVGSPAEIGRALAAMGHGGAL